jgi:tRNA C32,U32 (ribose-2'-O)-methylase TrmJ
MFNDWERGMWGIEFFKTRSAENVMRGFRELMFRADLDQRESNLIRAMGIEILRYMERRGGVIAEPPGGAQGAIGSGMPPVPRSE